MVSGGGYGVLCTNASSKALAGYPAGSVAGFAAAAEDGMPIFAFSSMSGHTGDLREDGRCSMVVQAAPEGGADSARVTLTGMVEEITDATLSNVVVAAMQSRDSEDAEARDFAAAAAAHSRR